MASPGYKIRADLFHAAKRRAAALREIEKIDREFFKPLGIDPKKIIQRSTQNGIGRPTYQITNEQLILKMIRSRQKITTKQILDIFKKQGRKTLPNVVLSRLKRTGTIYQPKRGFWSIKRGQR